MGPDALVRMGYVAKRFYRDGRTRIQISDELQLSRFKVARILEEALERGIVKIEISTPDSIDFELSLALKERFGLTRAIAVVVPGDLPELTQDHLGRAAAALLTEIVVEGDVVGLTAGRTITAMANHLNELAFCEVVQLAGVAGPAADNGVEVIRRVSRVSHGRSHAIFAPLLVENAETAATLRREPAISTTLRRFDSITKAVLAIGSWSPPDSQLYDTASQLGILDDLLQLGVQAEVCSTLLDKDGQTIDAIKQRAIAISTAQLRAIPEVIAVAGGPFKTAAVAAALKSGIVNSLVTDTSLAQRLLDA
jgi:DNA-binding transcriptional regulator LsrR (DeoR family)